MKKFLKYLLTFMLFLGIFPVGALAEGDDLQDKSFDEIVEMAKGSTVSFYGWGGDEQLNNWLDTVYAPVLKEKYDITLNRLPMDIDQVLNQFASEKQAGEGEGDIDMVWINGENFKTAKENDFLYGPFTQLLPNFNDYVDADNVENQYDFGYPIEGYEAPYGKAQMVMIKDSEKAPETPKNAEEFLEFAKAHQGQVTYPALPDFTGSAFVRNIIYEFVDPAEFQDLEADKEVVKEKIEPALDYLRSLNPYLWNEGKSFPASAPEQENMFMDGELVFHTSYGSFDAAIGIEEGRYPKTAETFVFDKGTIGNVNFIAVGKNAKNKAGALVAINEMLSPEMQASRYETMYIIPVLDPAKMSDEQNALFDQVEIGEGVVPQDELLDHRLPEMPAQLVPIIEEIWLEEVVGK